MKTSFPREIFCTVADKIKSWKWSIGNQSKCRWCHHSITITLCNQQLSHNDKKYFINKTFHCVKWCIFTVWYCFYLRIWTLLSPAALKSSSEQSKCLCSHLKNSHSQFALFERSTEVKTNEWQMIFKEHQSRMSTDYERRWEKKYSATRMLLRRIKVPRDWWIPVRLVDVTTALLIDTEVMWTLSC